MRSNHILAFLAAGTLAMGNLPASWSPCPGDFNGDEVVDAADYAALSACLSGPGILPGPGCVLDADADGDGDVDLADVAVFQSAYGRSGVKVSLPVKALPFNVITIHDPGSADYDTDCIACHGEKLNELALDCETPTPHSRMLDQFPLGNDRCLACHESGTNLINESAGGLRRQVDMEFVQCTLCHNEPGQLGAPVWYVRP